MISRPAAASVARLVERGKARNPQLSARLERAATIVLAGEYQTTSDPDTLSIRGYHVNGACECPDYTLGHAPTIATGRRCCKHVLAKAMIETLAEESTPAAGESPDVWRQSMAWVDFARSYH